MGRKFRILRKAILKKKTTIQPLLMASEIFNLVLVKPGDTKIEEIVVVKTP